MIKLPLPPNIKTNYAKGFGLIEVLITTAILAIVITGLMMLGSATLKISYQLKKNAIAANLAAETIEAVMATKKESWDNVSSLAINTQYHPTITAGSPAKWTISSGNETINGFSRAFILSAVGRDANDNIVSAGGIDDPNTKKITATVTWSDSTGDHQTVLTSYLTNW